MLEFCEYPEESSCSQEPDSKDEEGKANPESGLRKESKVRMTFWAFDLSRLGS